jgi:hypothetical protein
MFVHFPQVKDKPDGNTDLQLTKNTKCNRTWHTPLLTVLCGQCASWRELMHLVRPDVLLKITVFWCVMLCSPVKQYQCVRETFCLHQNWRWRQQAPLGPRSVTIRLHCATAHMTDSLFLNLKLPRSQTSVCRPHSHSSSLQVVFCHCRLSTRSTSFKL